MKRENEISGTFRWGLVSSVLLHIAIVWTLNQIDFESLVPPKTEPELVEVSFNFELPKTEPLPEVSEDREKKNPEIIKKEKSKSLDSVQPPPQPKQKISERKKSKTTTIVVEKKPEDKPASLVENAKQETDPKTKDWSKVQLDPSSISFGSIDFQNPDGTSSDSGPIPSSKNPSRGEQEARIRENISGSLKVEANQKRYATSRKPPKLKPKGNGSFAYEGNVFSARIFPDGSVSFSDRKISMDPIFGKEPPASTKLTFRFDATAAIEKSQGTDPLYAERLWFMKQTEELREELARKYNEKQLEKSLQTLRRKLISLWKNKKQADAQKRVALFKLWDDCSEDEMGKKAKEVIVNFIQRNAPKGSLHAFTSEELKRFNQQKSSSLSFAPYKGS